MNTTDPTPWVDDNLEGRWSTEKMEAYKAHGTSFTFAYEPREAAIPEGTS